MRMYVTVMIRVLLYVSLAFMVYDFVKLEQQFALMERGYTDGFSTYVTTVPGKIFVLMALLLLVVNIVDIILVKKNRHANWKAYIIPEYDVRDERSVEITGKAVRMAFAFILVYAFFVIGSYLFVPNYFLDYVWYPMMTTASIPIVGLLTYVITFKVLFAR